MAAFPTVPVGDGCAGFGGGVVCAPGFGGVGCKPEGGGVTCAPDGTGVICAWFGMDAWGPGGFPGATFGSTCRTGDFKD